MRYLLYVAVAFLTVPTCLIAAADWPMWRYDSARSAETTEVRVSVEPATAEYFYRHSVWMHGGEGWHWVAASGVEGASAVTIGGLRPGRFTVRLHFAEPHDQAARRKFAVALGEQSAIASMDIRESVGGSMRSVVREFRDVHLDTELRVELTAIESQTLLCGIELIREE